MKFPLVRELAAEGFPVRLTCGVLGFSHQAYYKWLADPVSKREWDYVVPTYRGGGRTSRREMAGHALIGPEPWGDTAELGSDDRTVLIARLIPGPRVVYSCHNLTDLT